MDIQAIFQPLYTADPEFAAEFCSKLTEQTASALVPYKDTCLSDIIWGLSEEVTLGKAIADGYIALSTANKTNQISVYHDWILKFGKQGPALGKIMAEHLVPILTLDDAAILQRFQQVIAVMLQKGAYTLYNPLNTLDKICDIKDKDSIFAYFDLLEQTFSLELTYKQCRPFTYTLPKAIISFSPAKRTFQTRQLNRIIRKDFTLSDYFLEGLVNGLGLLSEQTLDLFVTKGLEKYDKNKKLCAKFLSLGSKLGLDTFSQLQVTVPLTQVRPSITQYINARTGASILVSSIKTLPTSFFKQTGFDPMVCSDGRAIYLPEEITRFEDQRKNQELYKLLAKLETGYFEFGTFDFDLEKLDEKLTQGRKREGLHQQASDAYVSDFDSFLNRFSSPQLALDLFTLFEHRRILDLSQKHYPGLVRKLLPVLADQWKTDCTRGNFQNPVCRIYQELVLQLPAKEGLSYQPSQSVLSAIQKDVEEKFRKNPEVETSAELVFLTYPKILPFYGKDDLQNVTFFIPPFGRKIYPQLFFHGIQSMDHKAQLLKNRLERRGVRIYRSDIRKKLVQANGSLSPSDIKQLVLSPNHDAEVAFDSQLSRNIAFSQLDVSKIIEQSGIVPVADPDITGQAFYYREWDNRLGDYLQQHTLVHEKEIFGHNDQFYENTLGRFKGLVKQIRYAFELLKPEGIAILRQWIEGDEFDYRALLDFAMDKKAGIIPSDRLYIKKIKQQRDVAVLLLVDLSRSTANTVLDSAETVLDVEKQAIVLFCEALEIVGDNYAIAGFSGTGRLGADYFKIKDFDESLNDTIRQRINAMAPQRSTRMGAAIRHATTQIGKSNATVRLIIIIGDGFPNDVDYKKDYAISDTRKAILEARSRNIHTHALTVNISGDPKLDELYGPVHHHVISDVRELPDKLPRIYSSLTKY